MMMTVYEGHFVSMITNGPSHSKESQFIHEREGKKSGTISASRLVNAVPPRSRGRLKPSQVKLGPAEQQSSSR